MRKILFLCFLMIYCIANSCNSQTNSDAKMISFEDSLKNELKINDSIKILKIDKGFHSVAFIDFNKNSMYHSELLKYRGNNIDLRFYNDEYLKQKASLKRNNSIEIPKDLVKKWIRLYKYGGMFYVYMDCEFQMVYQTTDSTFNAYYMDGASPSLITEVLNQSKLTKLITIRNDTIDIESIDKNIYRIKIKNECNYFTPSDLINNFNIIVHHCQDETPDIIEFEKANCE
jgi:hypothetical protein